MAGKHAYYYDDELPKAMQRNNKKDTGNKKRKKKKNKKPMGLKVFGIIILVLIIILIAIVGSAYWYVSDKLGKMQQVEINEEDLGIANEVSESLSKYRNIAIFGVDSRSNNLEKGNRSDCIIIASINNETKDVKLISVYRDTYVQIDGHGLDKITHAYSYGSAQLAINTLNTNFDLNIKEFVTVNFNSVAEAVEELGGITINIESQQEMKTMNEEYIDEIAKQTGLSNKKVTKTGPQTLNGVQAVAYSRVRYTAGGDYKRAERMRTVIEAMLAKLKTKSIGQINTFMDNILPKVYTNISAGDVLQLLPSLANFNISDSIGWPYKTKGITLDRWYGVPVTLQSNVTQLHQEAFEEEDYIPSETVKTISNRIITKTGYRE